MRRFTRGVTGTSTSGLIRIECVLGASSGIAIMKGSPAKSVQLASFLGDKLSHVNDANQVRELDFNG